MKNRQLTWKKHNSEKGENLGILQVRHDWLEHPTSGKIMKRLVLESVDWVNVVALDPSGLSLMVEQYRFGIESCTLETPGGMVDIGESPLAAAKRELLEETGYGGGEWKYLGAVEPNPAFHPHLCHHFLVKGVLKISKPSPGEGESIKLRFCTLEEMKSALSAGTLRHVLALSALSRVFQMWDV